MRSIKDIEESIREALVAAGKYTSSIELQIYALAGALRSLDIANADLAALESTTIDTPQGKKAHPVFRIRKEAEDSVTRQMKALGLTSEQIASDIDSDPLVELTKKVSEAGNIRQRRLTVKSDRRGTK